MSGISVETILLMKFICLEMLCLLVISFTTIDWKLEAMLLLHVFVLKSYVRPKNVLSALNIKLLEPLAQGASRFEKSLAPPTIHWPPIFSNDISPSKTVVDIKTLK